MTQVDDYRNRYAESKSWNLWLDDLSTKSASTQRIYLGHFVKFLARWDTDPEDLFNTRLRLEASEDPRDKRVIEGRVKVSMKEVMDGGLSASTARQISKSVSSFFESQNLDFNMRARDQPKVYHNGQRVILKRQIRTLYERVSEEFRLRNRAIIMSLKDSGLRVSDVCSLNVGDYTGARTITNGAGEVFKAFEPVKVVKTQTIAYVHLGPEATREIDGYLEDRGPSDSDEPLFLDRKGNRIKPVATATMIYKLAKKLDDSERISAHSLRKHFQTSFEAAGVAKNWIGKFQGRIVGDSSGAYSKPEETGQLTEAYVSHYDTLRIFGVEASAQKVQEQENKIAELEAKVARYESERETMITREEHGQLLRVIEGLKRRMDEYEKTKG